MLPLGAARMAPRPARRHAHLRKRPAHPDRGTTGRRSTARCCSISIRAIEEVTAPGDSSPCRSPAGGAPRHRPSVFVPNRATINGSSIVRSGRPAIAPCWARTFRREFYAGRFHDGRRPRAEVDRDRGRRRVMAVGCHVDCRQPAARSRAHCRRGRSGGTRCRARSRSSA